ncbi:hypothetical protein HN615_05370 [Candidatus Woesearchaeota archaeon]|jgi:hypothetical protein|nr:hypothetical protein [Candidatus Woesearchaeota archaeon]
MRNRNKVLDLISTLQEEIDRLYHRIPEEVNDEFDLQLKIIRNCLKQLELIQNFIELEADGIQ